MNSCIQLAALRTVYSGLMGVSILYNPLHDFFQTVLFCPFMDTVVSSMTARGALILVKTCLSCHGLVNLLSLSFKHSYLILHNICSSVVCRILCSKLLLQLLLKSFKQQSAPPRCCMNCLQAVVDLTVISEAVFH